MSMFRMPIFTWNMLVTSVLVLHRLPGAHRGRADAVLRPSPRRARVRRQPRRRSRSCGSTSSGSSATPRCTSPPCPYFGVITEVLPVFSWRPVFGYKGLVFATLAIAALSVGVWAHHMFATGAVRGRLLQRPLVPHRGAHRRQVLQLDRHDVEGPAHVPHADAVRRRVPAAVPARRADRRDPGVAAGRLPAPRHVLRRRPHALRAVRRLGVRRCSPASTTGSRSSPGSCLHEGWGKLHFWHDVHRASTSRSSCSTSSASRACRAGSPATCPPTGSRR